MRQRAALARVLVLDPPVLLMDEPFGALDANTRERLQETLLGLLEAHRRTVLFVTHSVDEAAYLADRVAILGPPPTNIRAVVSVEAPRPRHRASAGLLGIAADLRRHLDEMPCCVGPE
jgi:NitT/TauT family transport system ATP-binding protein